MTCLCTVGFAFDLKFVSTLDGIALTVENLTVTERSEIMNQSSIDNDNRVKVMRISDQTVNFIPKFTELLAQRLTVLQVDRCHLKFVSKEDLRQFPQLKEISLLYNDLEWLEGDLFESNPKLEVVLFSYNNELMFIGANLIDSLPQLRQASFNFAGCMKYHAYNPEMMQRLKIYLKTRCKDTLTEQKMLAERNKTTNDSTVSI